VERGVWPFKRLNGSVTDKRTIFLEAEMLLYSIIRKISGQVSVHTFYDVVDSSLRPLTKNQCFENYVDLVLVNMYLTKNHYVYRLAPNISLHLRQYKTCSDVSYNLFHSIYDTKDNLFIHAELRRHITSRYISLQD
jgi:hypothetical protein